MTKRVDTTPVEASSLRIIPISKAGVPGFSFGVARTDDEEVAIRKSAQSQGLLAGTSMSPQPDPSIWSMIRQLKDRSAMD